MAELISMLFPFLILFVLMYFMIIRPQRKRDKLTKQMLDGLIVGDKILTIGGVVGKIVQIKDDEICIETGSAKEKCVVCFKRTSVSEVIKPAPETKQQPTPIPTDDKE
ncbi:MAG: preprotein translocase subunit YajC [Clostridia bacterium]|nr:preprotein translocase subunit YajC [Clostridia bacterium]